ncbi:hypothetical protein JOD54_002158 [Actinokineospora baliensis]|nr:hypothetical protein [Actinokineospora baliensis]
MTRDDDGGTYLHGRPGYTGDRSEDEELRDQLSAKTRAAELQLGLDARERAAKREDPVELAIKRLEYLTASMHPSSRTAFATYVAVRLARAWK